MTRVTANDGLRVRRDKLGEGSRRRTQLMRSAAAGIAALLSAGACLTTAASAGPQSCSITGAVAVCTGDQSSGIANTGPAADLPASITSLTVRDLSGAIVAPKGIVIVNSAPVSIEADLGQSGISAASTGAYAEGSHAAITLSGPISINNPGGASETFGVFAKAVDNASVVSNGTIIFGGDSAAKAIGVGAEGQGTVSVTTSGDLQVIGAEASGVSAIGNVVTVTSEGGITVMAGFGATGLSSARGINAVGLFGNTALSSRGDIAVEGGALGAAAIWATSVSGSVTVTSTGDLDAATPSGAGIGIYAAAGTSVDVTSTGAINVSGGTGPGPVHTSFGISAQGAIARVTSEGDIHVNADDNAMVAGIVSAATSQSTATVTGGVTVVAGDDSTAVGISVSSNTAATLSNVGDISAIAGNSAGGNQVTDPLAIGASAWAIATGGTVSLTSEGNITVSKGNGGSAYALSAWANQNAQVFSRGDVSASGGNDTVVIGIFAQSDAGDASLISEGAIAVAQGSGGSATGLAAQVFGAVFVNQTGNIDIDGWSSAGVNIAAGGGIRYFSQGDINVVTHGTGDETAAGILLTSQGEVAAGALGAITVSRTQGGEAAGISATGSVASVQHGGTLTVTGGSETRISGLYVEGTSTAYASQFGDVSISASGATTSLSQDVPSLIALGATAENGDATAFLIGGHITASSPGNGGAAGVLASATNGSASASNFGSVDVEVRNSGGAAVGVMATARHNAPAVPNASVTSMGSVSARAGDNGVAIGVASGSASAEADLTAGGTITATAGAGGAAFGVFANGSAGKARITSTADITAHAADAAGIYGRADDVAIVSAGRVHGDTFGIYAQGETMAVRITGGLVSAETGAGVALFGTIPGTSVVENAGTIGALSGLAIRSNTGSAITNTGTINGGVELGTSAESRLDNMQAGVLNSGSQINLGGQGVLTNWGLVAPGGSGTIATTAVTGTFNQAASGQLAVDLDLAAQSADRVTATGSAQVAGSVVVNPVTLKAGHIVIPIVTAENGVAFQDAALVAPLVLNAALVTTDANTLAITTDLDFAVTGLTAEQLALASLLNAAAASNDSAYAPLIAAMLRPASASDYAAALASFAPVTAGQLSLATQLSGQQFGGDLLSCRVADGDGATIIREGQCLWARAKARYGDYGTGLAAAHEATGAFSAGLQVALAPDWRLGAALGYEGTTITGATGAQSDGDRISGGLVVKYNPGRLLLAASALAGATDWSMRRTLVLPGFASQITGDTGDTYVGGRLHAAYLFDVGALYLKPIAEAGITHVEAAGFTEQGIGGMTVQGFDTTVVNISPALEVGSEIRFEGLSVWRPFVRAGLTWLDQNRMTYTANFSGIGGAGIESLLPFDDLYADLSAGLDIIAANGSALRFQYEGHFGDTTSQSIFGIKGSAPF